MINSEFKNQEDLEEEIEIPRQKPKPRWRRFAFGFWILFLIVVLVGIGGTLIYKTGFTFSQINVGFGSLPLAENEATPAPDADRINILVLGLRGEGDPDGGLLTDSMMVLIIKKSTGQTAIISIPRDLYVAMPGEKYKEKINFAYALGFEKRGGAGGGLLYSKIAVSRSIGLNLTYGIVVDHVAFREIVDILGGIDISLEKPFIEDQQWISGGDAGLSPFFSIKANIASTSDGIIETKKWVFEIPVGTAHLDGNSALYFARARFSSSDFDRARRQQLIIQAIKNKALTLGILGNPVKLFQILDSLGKNVRTDLTVGDMQNFLAMYPNLNTKSIIHRTFDTTPEGLLYDTRAENGAYILLPVGDNFDKIKEVCKNIFQ